MLSCYTALVELDSPESAVQAAAILDHHAEHHSAVVQTDVGRPELMITLPADDLDHAVQWVRSLVRVTGYRPVRVQVMTCDDFDRRERGNRHR